MAGPTYSRIRDDVPQVVVTSPSLGRQSHSAPSSPRDDPTVLFERTSFDSASTGSADELYPPHRPPKTPPRSRKKRSRLVFLVPACVLVLLAVVVVQPASVTSAVKKATGVVYKTKEPSVTPTDVEETSAEELGEEDTFDVDKLASEEASKEKPSQTHPPPQPAEESKLGILQRKIKWKGEDVKLRKYSWGEHAPHESLTQIVNKLDEESRRVRAWLLATRPDAQSGTGIGLAQSTPPQSIRPAPAASRPHHLPTPSEGPGEYNGGSYPKYSELLQEWQTGEQVSACVKGSWEDDYTVMHDEIMRGKQEPKLLEYHCFLGHNCGGLADRMLGVMTAFLYSILTKRAFSISWEHPVPFDLLFDSPNIDWSHPYQPNSSSTPHPIYSNPALIEKRTDLTFLNWAPSKIDQFFPSVPALWSTYADPWIRFVSNRGFVLRAFSYTDVAENLHSMGLTHTNAYSCMLTYLLRPKKEVLRYVAEYTTLFSLPKYYSIAIQIRTGDSAMADPEADKLNTVEKHQAYFTCAEQVEQAYARSDQRVLYYLISDSEHLKSAALARWPEKVLVSGLGVRHTEFSTSGGVFAALDGMMNSIAEMWTLAGTDFQVLTDRSGFGKIPTWLRGRPGSTVAVPKTGSIQKHPLPDCGLDIALVSYSDMASSWSLGR